MIRKSIEGSGKEEVQDREGFIQSSWITHSASQALLVPAARAGRMPKITPL